MHKEWIDVLTKSVLFERINNDELSYMLACLQPRILNYKKNETITMAGDKYTGLGIVLAGAVAVTKETAAGNRIIIAILNSAEMFGEMAAFSGKKVWPATVVAQEDCEIMFLAAEKIIGTCEKACVSHKLLILNMLKIISSKALVLNRKVEYLSIKSLRGKISNLLLEQHKYTGETIFIMPLNRSETADFLNVSRPSLSREMCKMRDEGIIEFHKSSVRIKKLAALKEMIE